MLPAILASATEQERPSGKSRSNFLGIWVATSRPSTGSFAEAEATAKTTSRLSFGRKRRKTRCPEGSRNETFTASSSAPGSSGISAISPTGSSLATTSTASSSFAASSGGVGEGAGASVGLEA
eukprot:CAMPEP_0194776986 /NCGR_PEP_ID=MMETSP0323_2-20130528/64446_2 /TAXON_ID=2866 ORGANISM="Crypthecodinium cohnii, Strain Seligo" /NCGR_SAMPLE_ID=MMETSP0323_2 /ASSEMBLY_ACC=CAM_ASM_000346 /LENGTH=122 /DNA_ID=CAMNT_0039713611 /DNA_START=70 /DNA_END=438 /DNA_ORIENTATION=-